MLDEFLSGFLHRRTFTSPRSPHASIPEVGIIAAIVRRRRRQAQSALADGGGRDVPESGRNMLTLSFVELDPKRKPR